MRKRLLSLALALVLADLMWQIADVRYQPILEEAGAVTLADIEGSSMSRTQKTVIVVAVLAIVAFVLWCNFAR